MSEVRGRVRQAPPAEVTSIDAAEPEYVPGGWIAQLVTPEGAVRGYYIVWGSQPVAFEAALRMLRWFERYGRLPTIYADAAVDDGPEGLEWRDV